MHHARDTARQSCLGKMFVSVGRDGGGGAALHKRNSTTNLDTCSLLNFHVLESARKSNKTGSKCMREYERHCKKLTVCPEQNHTISLVKQASMIPVQGRPHGGTLGRLHGDED